jgi:hypothetical protein
MAQVKIRFLNKGVQVKDNWIRLYRFMYDGCHSNIYIDAKIPSEKFDSVSVVLWNAGGDKKMTMDNLKVVAF